MRKEEWIANLFRLTQAKLKIKKDNTKGQSSLKNTAKTVGKQIRKVIIEISGIKPEDLPLADDIKKLKTKIHGTEKNLKNRYKQLIGSIMYIVPKYFTC